jgi:hypothetical protein
MAARPSGRIECQRLKCPDTEAELLTEEVVTPVGIFRGLRYPLRALFLGYDGPSAAHLATMAANQIGAHRTRL